MTSYFRYGYVADGIQLNNGVGECVGKKRKKDGGVVCTMGWGGGCILGFSMIIMGQFLLHGVFLLPPLATWS